MVKNLALKSKNEGSTPGPSTTNPTTHEDPRGWRPGYFSDEQACFDSQRSDGPGVRTQQNFTGDQGQPQDLVTSFK